LSERSYPKHIARAQAAALHRAIQKTHVPAPRTDCIVPVGEENLLKGLRKELEADFFTVTTRPAAAYRGNPFQVEVGIAYGRKADADIEIDAHGHMHKKASERADDELMARKDEPVRLLRYANRVPLLYQQASCAITKAVMQTNWRGYGLQQSKGALPIAPMAIVVHVASVWVPYTSESKEAIEPYPEIMKEIKLGLQKCGRELAHHLRHAARLHEEYDRRSYIEKFLPHIGIALQEMLAITDQERDAAVKKLDDTLHESRTEGRGS
jgi:DNA topoisomerase VI subunit B